jgi:hypothetical protein
MADSQIRFAWTSHVCRIDDRPSLPSGAKKLAAAGVISARQRFSGEIMGRGPFHMARNGTSIATQDSMLGTRLLQLIQAHAGPLTHDVVKDLLTNERTPTFRRLNAADVETRVSALFYNLGRWIGDADEHAIQIEYEDMGRARFREGVRVSELVYALLITKHHLRHYIREHGLVDFAGDRIVPQELLPLELHSIQDLNYQVGDFFDRALYHLARGYEHEAASGVHV